MVCFFFSHTVNTVSHISRRMERLIKDGILLDLDFSVFDTCA